MDTRPKGFVPLAVIVPLLLVAVAGAIGVSIYVKGGPEMENIFGFFQSAVNSPSTQIEKSLLPTNKNQQSVPGWWSGNGDLPGNTTTQQKSPGTTPVNTSNTTTPAPTTTVTTPSQPAPAPRTPNPPLMEISSPAEMQSVVINSGQTLCVVDVPKGGDNSSLKRKQNINDTGWSGYTELYTLCLDPNEGLNKIQLQYKNSFNDESVVYTRQFNFHRIQNISVTLGGTLYADSNCNGQRDSGENGLSVLATVNVFKLPEFYIYDTVTSGNGGTYTSTKTILENESIQLQPYPVSPSGYTGYPKGDPPAVILSASNRSATVDIPQIPYENYANCQ